MLRGRLVSRILVALMLIALAASPSDRGRGSDSRRPAAPPRIVQEDEGFHWADAAVGGAAALGLVLVLAGGDALRARRNGRGGLRG